MDIQFNSYEFSRNINNNNNEDNDNDNNFNFNNYYGLYFYSDE